MVDPVSDSSNQLNTSVNGSLKFRDPSQEKGGSYRTNVSLSEKAQQFKMFGNDHLLNEVLKKEFNEVFRLGGDKKDSFLIKLDHIFMNNSL